MYVSRKYMKHGTATRMSTAIHLRQKWRTSADRPFEPDGST